jgi:hypothetical protein
MYMHAVEVVDINGTVRYYSILYTLYSIHMHDTNTLILFILVLILYTLYYLLYSSAYIDTSRH